MFDLMRALPLFQGFPDADLAQLADGTAEQHLEAGEVLFWQGEAGHECYVILAGELEVLVHPGRSEIRLEVRQAGQLIGEDEHDIMATALCRSDEGPQSAVHYLDIGKGFRA